MDIPIEQLRALSAIIETGTFDAAARRLGVTPSAVSQRVRALETAVGRVVVLRSKPAAVTEAGEALLMLARQVEASYREASQRLDPGVRMRVPVVVNADSLATWALEPLVRAGGRAEIEILREDEGHSAERLRDGSAMAAVTSDPTPVAGCEIELLGRMRYRPCASPDFVARWFPAGAGPSAYAKAPMVVFDRKDDLQDAYLRRRARATLDPPRSYVPATSQFMSAIELGLGWAMLPDLQSQPGISSGSLMAFDGARYRDVPLYWQRWRIPSAALADLSSRLRDAARAALL